MRAPEKTRSRLRFPHHADIEPLAPGPASVSVDRHQRTGSDLRLGHRHGLKSHARRARTTPGSSIRSVVESSSPSASQARAERSQSVWMKRPGSSFPEKERARIPPHCSPSCQPVTCSPQTLSARAQRQPPPCLQRCSVCTHQYPLNNLFRPPPNILDKRLRRHLRPSLPARGGSFFQPDGDRHILRLTRLCGNLIRQRQADQADLIALVG